MLDLPLEATNARTRRRNTDVAAERAAVLARHRLNMRAMFLVVAVMTAVMLAIVNWSRDIPRPAVSTFVNAFTPRAAGVADSSAGTR
jgi:hypothetical protein